MQQGCLAHGQLVALGVSEEQIAHALSTGRLLQIHRGVYEFDRAPRELRLEAAALLTGSPGATLTGLSVLVSHGLVSGEFRVPVHLAVLGDGRHCHSRADIRVHRYSTLDASDVRIHRGLPMTTVERALLDAADTLTGRPLERAVDEALSAHRTSRTKLREMAGQAVGRRGREELIALADARRPNSETKRQYAELALQLIRAAQLPEPETEVSMLGFSMDFFFREAGVVVEVDPFSIHGLIRANFNRDRRKARACRDAGLELISVTGDELTDTPLVFVSDLAQTIGRRSPRRAA